MDIVLDTTTHDLVIEDNDLVLFDRIENETVQKVKMNLLLFKGEWFRDVEYGVPYLQNIFGKKNTKTIADSFLKNAIIQTQGITSITEFSSTLESDRVLRVTFSAITESGEIINNVTVEI